MKNELIENEFLFLDVLVPFAKYNSEALKRDGHEMKISVDSYHNFSKDIYEKIAQKIKIASSFIAKQGKEGPATTLILREGFHLNSLKTYGVDMNVVHMKYLPFNEIIVYRDKKKVAENQKRIFMY